MKLNLLPAVHAPGLDRSEVDACSLRPPADPPSVPRDEKAATVARLRRIPELLAELPLFLEPGAAPADPEATRGKSRPDRPPLRVDVLDLLDQRRKSYDDARRDASDRCGGYRRFGVAVTLSLWARLIADELDLLLSQDQDDVAWLIDHIEDVWNLHADDFGQDVRLMTGDLERAVSYRPPLDPVCPSCSSSVERVYDEPDDSDRTISWWWRCTGCPHTWAHDAEIQRLLQTQPPRTLNWIARYLDVPVRTLRKLADTGRISPVESRGDRKLYDVDAVRAVYTRGERDDAQPVKAVAKAAAVSVNTIRRWVEQGRLHAAGTDVHGRKLYSIKVAVKLARRGSRAS